MEDLFFGSSYLLISYLLFIYFTKMRLIMAQKYPIVINTLNRTGSKPIGYKREA
jgi:hypothetical protein